jgi:hypothetical protein
MEKENARKQTLEQLHERRKQVVRLHKKGIKVMQIVALTGLSYPPVRARLREAANEHMAMLEQNPERVIGCFQDRRVRYAA